MAPSAGFGVKSISPLEYLFTQFNVIVYYIALLLVPINQNLDYDFPVSRGLFEMPVVKEGTVLNIPILPPVVSLSILLAIVAVAVWLFFRYKRTGEPRALAPRRTRASAITKRGLSSRPINSSLRASPQ